MQIALYITFVFWVLQLFENFANFQVVSRPIIMATVAGLALGDIKTGIIMGGLLEAVFMGISGVGGVRPARQDISSFFCVTMVIQSGIDIETALALAMPFGALASAVFNLYKPVNVMFIPLFDKWAKKGDTKGFDLSHILFGMFIKPLGFCLILFAATLLGTEQAATIIALIPQNVMTGINAAGSMLPIVGYAILATMLWTKARHFIWIFFGFLLATYMNLSILAIACFAGIIAVVTFLNDYEQKQAYAKINCGISEETEDFING